MKVLIAIMDNDVAPRFDITVEAVIAELDEGTAASDPRVLVLSEPSGDELCALAVSEGVDVVICGGIDEVHYDYLQWKNIRVVDGVIGAYAAALDLLERNELLPDAILSGTKPGSGKG